MKVDKKEINKTEIVFSIELETQEMEKFLKLSAERLSNSVEIKGFRPGQAPYDAVKREVGEIRIYEQALDDITAHYCGQVLAQEKIQTIGQPKIGIEKFAPGNNLIFTTTVALLPQVKLGKYIGLKIKRNRVEIDDKEVDAVINDLLEGRAKESAKLTPVEKGDKVEVDFKISLNGKSIDQGEVDSYPLVIGSNRMIMGFEDQLMGLSAGENKRFKLKFPASYHDKLVADKECDFEIKITNVFKREVPQLNNEFVKTLGDFKDVDGFKNRIKDNIKAAKEFKEKQKAEIDMLEKIVGNSEFDPIPGLLIDAESHKMIHELQHSIEAQGMVWEDYLSSLKKDEESLEAEFKEGAEHRVKTSLIMREITIKEDLKVDKLEVESQINKLTERFKDNSQAQENLQSEGYEKYLENSLNNEKVLQFLREKNIIE